MRGTQVSGEAADIVLRDDAFSTIVSAVRQGRIIFANIGRLVTYLLSCNLSEVLIVGLAVIAGLPLPLLPLQIFFLNLVFNMRTATSDPLNYEIVRNPFVWGAIALCTALVLGAPYVPGVSHVLSNEAPGWTGWMLVLCASLMPLAVGESYRFVVRRRGRRVEADPAV